MRKRARRSREFQHRALLLSYIGTSYRGLQLQPEHSDTIDDALLRAVHEEGLLPEYPGGSLRYHRSCRTDKGVHALRNLVSLEVPREIFHDSGSETKTEACYVRRINERLPHDINVIRFPRVTSDFRARESCSRRRYHYLIPLYALEPEADDAEDFKRVLEQKELSHTAGRKIEMMCQNDDNGCDEVKNATKSSPSSKSSNESHTPALVPYYTDLVRRFNEYASQFLGVHCFHNFVGEKERLTSKSDESVRVIHQCEILTGNFLYLASDPVVEYVVFCIEAQSFLLHMIQKVVGTCIALCRGVPSDLLEKALQKGYVVDTPLSPASNLYLHTPYYYTYDKNHNIRMRQTCSQSTNACVGLPCSDSHVQPNENGRSLTESSVPLQEETAPSEDLFPKISSLWESSEAIDRFQRRIWEEIGRIEKESMSMTKFIRMLRMHNWSIRKESV